MKTRVPIKEICLLQKDLPRGFLILKPIVAKVMMVSKHSYVASFDPVGAIGHGVTDERAMQDLAEDMIDIYRDLENIEDDEDLCGTILLWKRNIVQYIKEGETET